LPPTYVFLSACLLALIAAVATAFLALPGRRTSSIAALGMASVKVLVFDLLADDANPDVARQALKRLIYNNLLQLRGHYASLLNSNPGVTLTGNPRANYRASKTLFADRQGVAGGEPDL
jgi:hypothetical protein